MNRLRAMLAGGALLMACVGGCGGKSQPIRDAGRDGRDAQPSDIRAEGGPLPDARDGADAPDRGDGPAADSSDAQDGLPGDGPEAGDAPTSDSADAVGGDGSADARPVDATDAAGPDAADAPGEGTADSMPDAPGDDGSDARDGASAETPAEEVRPFVERTCTQADACSCSSNESCLFTCSSGDCSITCAAGSLCTVTCASPYGCAVACGAGAQCTLACNLGLCYHSGPASGLACDPVGLGCK